MKLKNTTRCIWARIGMGVIFSVLLFLALSLFFDGFYQGAAFFLSISIVCTMGMTLPVYVLIFYIFGVVFQKMFFSNIEDCTMSKVPFVARRVERVETEELIDGKIFTEERELIDYIAQVKDVMSREDIERSLLQVGWKKQLVDTAMQSVYND